MSILEASTTMQEQFLDAIKTSQDAILSTVDSFVESAAPITEKLPAAPFADQMPSAVDVIDNAFSFAQKLLANQKDFALKLANAYSPAKPAATKTGPKAAAKAA